MEPKTERFGRLVVQEYFTEYRHWGGRQKPVIMAKALCDCGAVKVIRKDDLRHGTTLSCGCLRRELAVKRSTRHGETGTMLHETWMAMRERCKYDDRYRSRGITVATEWESSYETFRDYVHQYLGRRPRGGSLDRIDNDRGYEPGNIRWASKKGQMRNKFTNTLLTVDGRTQCLAEWAEEMGISSAVICQRRKHGWSDHDAVTTPVQREALTINGRTQLAAEWSRETGIPEALIAMRKLRGITGAGLIAPVQKARTYTIQGEAKTLAEWAQTVGIDVKLIDLRLRRGWTEEEAVFGKVKK